MIEQEVRISTGLFLLPLDPLETMLVLDCDAASYLSLIQQELLPSCKPYRDFFQPLLRFHNLWNIFEYRARLIISSYGIFDEVSFTNFLDEFAAMFEECDDEYDIALWNNESYLSELEVYVGILISEASDLDSFADFGDPAVLLISLELMECFRILAWKLLMLSAGNFRPIELPPSIRESHCLEFSDHTKNILSVSQTLFDHSHRG